MDLDESLDRVVARFEELAAEMAGEAASQPEIYTRLSREYAELSPVVERVRALQKAASELADLKELMREADGDAEMRRLAEEEYHALKERLPMLEEEVKRLLLPKDAADEKNAFIEIRAGTGGEEAALLDRKSVV